ncbi:MAG: hypothetical protein CSB47_00505 [Proteobacteria bacterium]|nr:MAG: hypothetical protein CSB47_00505 [Pseudomonadota bacterium]
MSEIHDLLNLYQLQIHLVALEEAIPGSFWGDEEAGLIKNQLYIRPDTPIHSLLHESCHYICMDEQRRQHLHTNAGGTADEENAVCYLQVLLSDELPSMGKARMMSDMDRWGYSFRLGSCRAWFERDTQDEYQWLLSHKLITPDNKPTFLLRT